MSNSSLVDFTKISPFKSSPRKSKIKKITIHHMAGNLSVQTCGNVFQSSRSSTQYAVDNKGKIGQYVDEGDRSWASGNRENDHQSVTIEVANDKIGGNWHVDDKAIDKLIELCADICKRNDIEKLVYTGDSSGNLTRHNMFANTACPGPYLQSKFSYIASEVNKLLNATDAVEETGDVDALYRVQVGAFSKYENAEGLEKELNIDGYSTYIIEVNDKYKVQVGAFSKKENAMELQEKLKLSDYDTFIVQNNDEIKETLKNIETVAKEVLDGKWGNGSKRKNNLIEAGYDYSEIQEKVNELLT